MIGIVVVEGSRIGRRGRHRAHGIKVVSDQTFLRNEDEKAEFFEDGNLSNSVDGDGSEPAAWVVTLGDVDAVIRPNGDHWVSIWLMEVGGAIDARSTHGVGPFLPGEAILGFANGTVERRALNDDTLGYTGHGIVGKSSVCQNSKSERLGVLLV